MVRADENDLIFKTKDEKFAAVVDDIAERHEEGQPVLVGTINIETSEHLSGLLRARGIPHNVLNAKQHEREAEIIADAGQPGAVTIATNMAGRGVDIKLGEGVPELGGLYVLGTERHESRRIDNQLRGRSGRQGDPGESRFYLSAEDEVVRLFAGDRIYKILDKLGPPEGEPIEHKLLTRQIEGAQKRVEEQNFEIRKNVLKYDDVLNKQREVVYAERRKVLEGQDISDLVREWIDETVERVVESHTESQFPEEWDLDGMMVGLRAIYPVSFTLDPEADLNREDLMDRVSADAQEAYERKEAELVGLADRFPDFPRDMMRRAERFYLLQTIDQRWREHLDNMDYLREGIHLRGLAQKDPLVEYRSEGHAMFQEMMREVEEEVVSSLFHFVVEIEGPTAPAAAEAFDQHDDGADDLVLQHEATSILDRRSNGQTPVASNASTYTAGRGGGASSSTTTTSVAQRHVDNEPGRNDPCPCGSGKKYKRCHGA
jgi:preprotein translocase subunit SecA